MAFGILGINHKYWHFVIWPIEQEALVLLASGSNDKCEWQMSSWQKTTGMCLTTHVLT